MTKKLGEWKVLRDVLFCIVLVWGISIVDIYIWNILEIRNRFPSRPLLELFKTKMWNCSLKKLDRYFYIIYKTNIEVSLSRPDAVHTRFPQLDISCFFFIRQDFQMQHSLFLVWTFDKRGSIRLFNAQSLNSLLLASFNNETFFPVSNGNKKISDSNSW